MKDKTPLQRYEEGEITLQKMFNEQDEETAFQVFVTFIVVFKCVFIFLAIKLISHLL